MDNVWLVATIWMGLALLASHHDPVKSAPAMDPDAASLPPADYEAAKAALDLGVPTYRFLRRYLERRLPAPLTLRQVDPLIRQLTLYRDLIDRKTGDPL